MMVKPFRSMWLLVLLVASGTVAAAEQYHLEQDVMVSMRDGVRLATDVYRPIEDGKPQQEALPVILCRLPYNKQGTKSMGAYYATHGYVFVAQDTRGRYNSEGVWHMLTDDGPDGVDCAAWIAKQSWSNGKIGMIGTSYVGGTQHAMALAGCAGAEDRDSRSTRCRTSDGRVFATPVLSSYGSGTGSS